MHAIVMTLMTCHLPASHAGRDTTSTGVRYESATHGGQVRELIHTIVFAPWHCGPIPSSYVTRAPTLMRMT